MGLLDLLMEKKDLNAYIDMRKDHLARTTQEIIKTIPEAQRELVNARSNARISELELLKSAVAQGKLKDQSKIYFKKTKFSGRGAINAEALEILEKLSLGE